MTRNNIRTALLILAGSVAFTAYLTLGSAETPVDEAAAAHRLETTTTAELCAEFCAHGEPTDFCCETCETCKEY